MLSGNKTHLKLRTIIIRDQENVKINVQSYYRLLLRRRDFTVTWKIRALVRWRIHFDVMELAGELITIGQLIK